MPQPNHWTIDETAAVLHEHYVSLMRAGFTPEQSMYLTVEIMKAGVSNARGDDGPS